MPPYQGGGGMIDEVKKENITFAESPTKFEAGTMQTAEVVAFSESIKLIEKIGLDKISENENDVLRYGIDKIRKNNSINLVGDPKNKVAINELVNSMNKLHKESYLKTIDASMSTFHDHIFQKIDIPTLIVVGEKDSLTPPSMALKIHQLNYY